ncbi:MAG: hypothetical protein C0624_03430 [Desulfuromonas sp.]|nr:MAG: hypothetical protein C0624_03430 [Desulfuromonas sp.]
MITDYVIADILLALSAVTWVACILVNLSIQLRYISRADGFLFSLFVGSLKFDYTSITRRMSSRDAKLYLFSFMGVFLLFIPGADYIGSVVRKYLY